MVNSIPRASNKDENGVSSWEKTVVDVNDVDENLLMPGIWAIPG